MRNKIFLSDSMGGGFSCIRCGACCKNAGYLISGFDRGDGVCKHLTNDNLCEIYEDRPTVCRVDEGYTLYFSSLMPYDRYVLENIKACNSLIEGVNYAMDGLSQIQEYLI